MIHDAVSTIVVGKGYKLSNENQNRVAFSEEPEHIIYFWKTVSFSQSEPEVE